MSGFKKAQKFEQYLRMSIQGASGAGKTRTALEIAKHLCPPGKRIALIDSEKSASLYSDVVDFDVDDEFGPIGKENYHQDQWRKKLLAAYESGYKVAILDSATHLWKGTGGMLSQIDAICAAQRAKGGKGDSFAAWKIVDPEYMKFMNFVRQLPMHVIFCIRAKQSYEKSEQGGKGSLRKVGMEPEYRDGFEYEFDIQCAVDMEHCLVPLKHRLGDALDGKVFPKAGKDFAEICLAWLQSGAPNQVPVSDAPAVTAQNPAVEDLSSPTPNEPQLSAVADGFRTRMYAAETEAALAEIAKEAGVAKKAGEFSAEDYKILSALFTRRLKSLKAVPVPVPEAA